MDHEKVTVDLEADDMPRIRSRIFWTEDEPRLYGFELSFWEMTGKVRFARMHSKLFHTEQEAMAASKGACKCICQAIELGLSGAIVERGLDSSEVN